MPIAVGGMAEVFRTVDLQNNGTPIAIKMFKDEVDSNPIWKEAFDREQRALRELSTHKNIVNIIDCDVDIDTGRRFLALEWIENTLSKVLQNRPVENWEEFHAKYGDSILQGLIFAYHREILHRDINPKNILVSEDGELKIADFGISKFKRYFVQNVTLGGFKTAPYAPLEDSYDNPDTRDVYSYVVTALECLSKREFTDRDDVLQFVENDVDCTDKSRSVILSALDLQPENRPANVIDLYDLIVGACQASKLVSQSSKKIGLIIANSVVKNVSEYTLQDSENAVKAFVINMLNDGILFKQHRRKNDDGEYELETDTYEFIATDFGFLVKRDQEDKSYLALISSWKLAPVALSFAQEDAIEIDFRFSNSNDLSAAESIQNLEEMIVLCAEKQNETERKKIANEKEGLFRKWRDALDIRREIESSREDPIRYSGYRVEGRRIYLTPEEQLNTDEDIVDQSRLIRLDDTVYAQGIVDQVDDKEVSLYVENYFDPENIPRNGNLVFDTQQSRIAINRQMDALEELRNNSTTRADLKELINKPGDQCAPSSENVCFIQDDLDESKRLAVSKAIGSKNILVVEGPPGTGKTKFIVETVLQHVKQNKSILLASQTHIAIDNALERTLEISADNKLSPHILRIGRKDDQRISLGVKKLLLGNSVIKWLQEVKENSKTGLEEWAIEENVDLQQVRIGMSFAKLKNALVGIKNLESDKQALLSKKDKINNNLNELKANPNLSGSEIELMDELDVIGRELNVVQTQIKEYEEAKDRAYRQLESYEEIGTEIYKIEDGELNEFENLYLHDVASHKKGLKIIEIMEGWQSRLDRNRDFEVDYLKSAQVVAGTCVGVAAHNLKGLEFDVCIVDEASKATPTETLVPIVKAKKWIVVGDTKQLPPYVGDFSDHREICEKFNFTYEDSKQTLLQHLVNELPDHSKVKLKEQYRMIKPIGDLISNCFYNNELESKKEFTKDIFIKCLAVPAPVSWLSTCELKNCLEVKQKGISRSFSNFSEIEVISKLVNRLELGATQEGKKYSVAIMSGYTAQVKSLERKLASITSSLEHLSIDICTVDTYQGREADIAIYSITRSNKVGQIGFLKERERINVALSRGRELLCIVGNHEFCESISHENPFIEILQYIRNHDNCELSRVSQ